MFMAMGGGQPVFTLTEKLDIITVNLQLDFKLDTDGYMYGAGAQINGDTDWVIPHAKASSLGSAYECGYTGLTGDPWDVEAAAEDAWVDCSSDRTWSLTPSASKSNAFTFRIRHKATATIVASADFACTLSVV